MKTETTSKLLGIGLMAALSVVAYLLSKTAWMQAVSFSPLIIGILLGMVVANTVFNRIPQSWGAGFKVCTKQILRTGIVLYGFRLTLSQVIAVGMPAIAIDCIIVTGTILLGVLLGRLLKMDADTALMTSTGSAICGAAAVLGAEPVVRCESHKTAVAVSTVVLFGTLSMFLYPIMYRMGWLDGLSNTAVAIYTGSTLHEVAHVAGAGNAMDPTDALGIAGTCYHYQDDSRDFAGSRPGGDEPGAESRAWWQAARQKPHHHSLVCLWIYCSDLPQYRTATSYWCSHGETNSPEWRYRVGRHLYAHHGHDGAGHHHRHRQVARHWRQAICPGSLALFVAGGWRICAG